MNAVVRVVQPLFLGLPEVFVTEIYVGIVKAEDFVAFQLHRNLLYDRPPEVVNNSAVGVCVAVQPNVKGNTRRARNDDVVGAKCKICVSYAVSGHRGHRRCLCDSPTSWEDLTHLALSGLVDSSNEVWREAYSNRN